MSKFVVIAFPDESHAYQGRRALKELHAEGSLTLYGMAVVWKDPEGNFGVKEPADAGPLGSAVGAVVGGLLGVIGGPAGVVVGLTGGTLIGSLTDLINYGVHEDFIWKVSKTMVEPGKTAVVAEIAETWTTPLDTRMESLGATVLRTRRADFEDDQIAREVAAQKADFEQLRAELAQASGVSKAKLTAKIDQAKANLQRAEERVQTRLDDIQNETDAKIAALEQQATDARADAKEKLKQRIAVLQSDIETRSRKLKQAWALAKEALAA
jgi:uncharacterized membrane protein